MSKPLWLRAVPARVSRPQATLARQVANTQVTPHYADRYPASCLDPRPAGCYWLFDRVKGARRVLARSHWKRIDGLQSFKPFDRRVISPGPLKDIF